MCGNRRITLGNRQGVSQKPFPSFSWGELETERAFLETWVETEIFKNRECGNRPWEKPKFKSASGKAFSVSKKRLSVSALLIRSRSLEPRMFCTDYRPAARLAFSAQGVSRPSKSSLCHRPTPCLSR